MKKSVNFDEENTKEKKKLKDKSRLTTIEEENAYRFFKGKNEPELKPQKFLSAALQKKLNNKAKKKFLK